MLDVVIPNRPLISRSSCFAFFYHTTHPSSVLESLLDVPILGEGEGDCWGSRHGLYQSWGRFPIVTSGAGPKHPQMLSQGIRRQGPQSNRRVLSPHIVDRLDLA